jgi:hypothetical protein
MVVATNDAFLSPTPGGVAFLDAAGAPRTTAAIEADFAALLAVWDAGTELGESPGTTGPNNGANQAAPGDGAADTDASIRYFRDATNDFADASAFVGVTIVQGVGVGEFEVTIDNASLGAAFEGTLSPIVWAVHDGSFSAFQAGAAASLGLEELAEDGLTDGLDQEIGDAGVINHGVTAGPIVAGTSTTFTVTTDATEPVFSFFTMVMPSNDSFVSLGGSGIALFSGGVPLTNGELATAVAAGLAVWDAGTEGNQSGGGGADMGGISAVAGTGPSEGNGLVRFSDNDPTWVFPPTEQLVRVTVTPL